MKPFTAFIGGTLLGGTAASVGFYFGFRNYVSKELQSLQNDVTELTRKLLMLEESLKEAWTAEKKANDNITKLNREIQLLEQALQERNREIEKLKNPAAAFID